MRFVETKIQGILIIKPEVHSDERGYFLESYNKTVFEDVIGKLSFIQDNESKSTRGVLRGLHFQKPPFAQAKLVRCTEGRVLDIAVDIRNGSKTYGQHISVELSKKNKRQLFVSRGFAHGFLVLSKSAIINYKVDNSYAPNYEAGIRWDDQELNIQWGLSNEEVLVSKKDSRLPFFKELKSPFNFKL